MLGIMKQKPHKPADKQVARIEAKIATAQEHLETVQRDANAAYLSAQDGGSDAAQQKAAAARATITAAQDNLAQLNGALYEARQREQTLKDEATATQRSEDWNKVDRLARDYESLAVKIETQLINLSDDYKALEIMSADLFKAAPVRSGHLRSAGLGNAQIEKSFRLHMVKLGHPWASSYPWALKDIPAFSAVMKTAAKAVMGLRAKELVQ
jgi:hypothetical protein